jgi:uncharacterized membrane protein
MSPFYIALGIAVLLLITIIALNSGMSILGKKGSSDETNAAKAILKQSRTTLLTLMIVSAAIFAGGQFLAGSGMEAHIMDWMNLLSPLDPCSFWNCMDRCVLLFYFS